jgi:hypothetical protein
LQLLTFKGTWLTLFGAAVRLSVVWGPMDGAQIDRNDNRRAARTQRHDVVLGGI